MGNRYAMREIVADELIKMNKKLGCLLDSDVIFLCSPLMTNVDGSVRDEIEIIQNKKAKLTVILETNGGSIEVSERIAHVFRNNYCFVDFIIPDYAYSAGTVLCMSGDNIYMDYYSVLGPIDPQVLGKDGCIVPGTGFLEKWNDFCRKSKEGEITTFELHYATNKFNPAELYSIEQALEHSKDLLKRWLVTYKFKDWKIKESSKIPVTEADKLDRAEEIAKILSNASVWHSHGRGITMERLISDDIKLKISDMDDENYMKLEVKNILKEYYGLLIDFINQHEISSVVHTCNGFCYPIDRRNYNDKKSA